MVAVANGRDGGDRPHSLSGFPDAGGVGSSISAHTTTHRLCIHAIHVAGTEHFCTNTGTDNFPGVALTTRACFILKPRDFFDGTPLYTPPARPEFD